MLLGLGLQVGYRDFAVGGESPDKHLQRTLMVQCVLGQ
jgi:hypothetical protein